METKLALPVQSKFSEEVAEWIEAFDDLIVGEGPEQGAELIAALRQRARDPARFKPKVEVVLRRIHAIGVTHEDHRQPQSQRCPEDRLRRAKSRFVLRCHTGPAPALRT